MHFREYQSSAFHRIGKGCQDFLIAEQITQILDLKPLKAESDFCLSKLETAHRISEMQFYYPLKTFQPDQLKAVLETNATTIPSDVPTKIGNLAFSPVHGFMRGFIDLVFQHKQRFYLIDWKTNYLGGRPEDYRAARLEAAMIDELYLLQAYLYSLALHQYLQMRLRDYCFHKHFGGCLYIFLRGINSSRVNSDGIYRCTPDAKLIADLGELLIPDFAVPTSHLANR